MLIASIVTAYQGVVCINRSMLVCSVNMKQQPVFAKVFGDGYVPFVYKLCTLGKVPVYTG